jgi:hypothetical protein
MPRFFVIASEAKQSGAAPVFLDRFVAIARRRRSVNALMPPRHDAHPTGISLITI